MARLFTKKTQRNHNESKRSDIYKDSMEAKKGFLNPEAITDSIVVGLAKNYTSTLKAKEAADKAKEAAEKKPVSEFFANLKKSVSTTLNGIKETVTKATSKIKFEFSKLTKKQRTNVEVSNNSEEKSFSTDDTESSAKPKQVRFQGDKVGTKDKGEESEEKNENVKFVIKRAIPKSAADIVLEQVLESKQISKEELAHANFATANFEEPKDEHERVKQYLATLTAREKVSGKENLDVTPSWERRVQTSAKQDKSRN